MPVTTLVGIIAMVLAMILYSIGAWGAFRKKTVTKKNVIFLVLGVVFDVLGTAMMYLAAGRFLWENPHTWVAFAGFFGMLGMTIAMAWASGTKEDLAKKLSTWVLAPWAIWAVSFVWGMAAPPKV